MKRLFPVALVTVLCAAPALSRAETPPRGIAAPATGEAQDGPASDGAAQNSEDEASDYAEREKASPELGEFAGGDDGIYIGSGVLLVALIVVLLLAL
jgi:hypothetical protein